MNWLAHLHLSEPTPAFRLGGILPDFAAPAALAHLAPEFQLGMQRHRQIDKYTDSHPIFRRSVQRLHPPFRRFGGVLIDVFYDHFLARDWESHSPTPLPAFAAEVYDSFDHYRADIPPDVYPHLQQMRIDNWLCTYGEIRGIFEALRRISTRLRRPFDLAPATAFLERDYDSLQADFTAFFQEVSAHIRSGTAPATSVDQQGAPDRRE